MLHNIEELLSSYDLSIIIANTNGDPALTKKYLDIFSSQYVSGIIVAQLNFSDESDDCSQMLEYLDTPIISIDRIIEGLDVPSIEVDQIQIGYIATKHLLSIGHKNIGCVSGDINLNVNKERYNGYKLALNEFGIEANPNLFFSHSLSIDCGKMALPYLLGQNVSAIFAFNDMIAYGIYKECRSYDLSIPDDISIVGVDDIEFSDIIYPPLTTVGQPIKEIAEIAVSNLIKLINSQSLDVISVKLNPFLKVRGSTKKFK